MVTPLQCQISSGTSRSTLCDNRCMPTLHIMISKLHSSPSNLLELQVLITSIETDQAWQITIIIFLLHLFIWEKEEVPAELKDVNIAILFKKGISLLSITLKIFTKILLNCLLTLSEDTYLKS